MNLEGKIFYNRASSQLFGWSLNDWGVDSWADPLLKKVRAFQRDNDLKADGCVGPLTFKRFATEFPHLIPTQTPEQVDVKDYIICNGQELKIDWPYVVPFDHPKALTYKTDKFTDPRNYDIPKGERDIRIIVTHWDGTKSAHSTHWVLGKSGLSTHFTVDNLGVIYQHLDPSNIGHHAGGVNGESVGIDMNCLAKVKHQRIYRKEGLPERPVLKGLVCHGKKLDLLGYNPIQIDAYKALVKALTTFYNIPLECPLDENGNLITTVYKPVRKNFRGVVGHYHVTTKKIDPINLDFVKILTEIKEEKEKVCG